MLNPIRVRKPRMLLMACILSMTLSGCASTLSGVMEAVVETTADAVGDLVVDVAVGTAQAMVDTAVEVTIDASVACIDNDAPVLRGALPNPKLNQEYNGTISVNIRNEPYDDAYGYAFEVYGDFPPGMNSESSGRQLTLTGTPTMPGEYDFRIRVMVEDGAYGKNSTRGLCFTVDDESFHWSIQQDEGERFALSK